jgi:hypothetical protein
VRSYQPRLEILEDRTLLSIYKVFAEEDTMKPVTQKHRLCLEPLEARCLPSTVTNLSDHDPGSLRDAIASTLSGGTVDFQPGLAGTITLTTGELAIAKDLIIAGPGVGVITVSGHNGYWRVFNITATVNISGLTIANGSEIDGGGI